MKDTYELNLKTVRIYFSGAKGFHIEISAALFGFEPSSELHRVFKAIAEKITPDDVIIDTSIYDKMRLWRLPNTINSKSGLYKIPLLPKEVLDLSIDEIKELAREPRIWRWKPPSVELNHALAALYREARENNGKERLKNSSGGKKYETVFNGWPIPEGERNSTLTSLAGYLKAGKIPINEAGIFLNSINTTHCSPPLEGEEVAAIIESVYSYPDPDMDETEPKVIRLAEYDPRPQRWFLQNAIPEGFPTLIYGDGGMGKTYLADLIAVQACISGESFFGLKFPEAPVNALLIDYELNPDEQTRRIRKIASGLNLKAVPDNLFYLSPDKGILRSIEMIKNIIFENSIGFIVIDSLGASGVDGEKVPDVMKLFMELRNLNITALVCDHQSKMQAGNRYEHKSPYGSAYKYNLSRSVFQINKIKAEPGVMTVSLRHTKSNFGPLIDNLVFDLKFRQERILFTKSVYKVPDPEAGDIELIKNAILTLTEAGKKATQSAIVEQLSGEIGKNKVSMLLKKGEGKEWEVTRGENNEKLYSVPWVPVELIQADKIE